MLLLLERFAYTKYGTVGTLTFGNLSLSTIELPWRGNERGRSCIPPGMYNAQRHQSPQHGDTLWLRGVPERSEILIHIANSPQDLDGCIAIGRSYGWWKDRGELAVWNSADGVTALLNAVQESTDTNTGIDIDIRTWRPTYP